MKQREEDFVSEMFVGSSHDHVLFFTNRGIMFDLKCYEIPMGGKDSKGTNIVNMLPLAENEKIAAMMKVSEFNDESYIVIVTKNGKIKRTALPAYKNVRKNGLIAIKLEEGDEIEGVRITGGSDQLIVATRDGMAIRVEETCIRPQGRSAHGVRIMKLRGDDEIVSMARVREGAALLTVTEKGFGKRTDVGEYRFQSRGGFGVTNHRVTEKTGPVASVKMVRAGEDILIVTDDGTMIRVAVENISRYGRASQGVRVMRPVTGSRVIDMEKTEREEATEVPEEFPLPQEPDDADQGDTEPIEP
jgi:DNA gyrase subunit A